MTTSEHEKPRGARGRYTLDPASVSAEIFWSKVSPEPNTGCWLWTGYRGKYGTVSVGNRSVSAHRRAYGLAKGPIPPGMYVLHRCDLPGCVNPAHLFLGTAADNSRDMVRKGRSTFGERHHGAKLTEAEVQLIRNEPRTRGSGRRLAQRFGVTPTTISAIRNGESWSKRANGRWALREEDAS